MTDFGDLWRFNRRWRAWMDAHTKFVTPAPLALLEYMANETGEASEASRGGLMSRLDACLAEARTIFEALGGEAKVVAQSMLEAACRARDMYMRAQYTGHARTNGRFLTVYEELADVAMLALTVLPDLGDWTAQDAAGEPSTINDICNTANWAVMSYMDDVPAWLHWVVLLVRMIDRYPGMQLTRELAKCHDRLAWKHASEQWSIANLRFEVERRLEGEAGADGYCR